MRNYVFGDTGGHMKQLFASLQEIGANPRTGYIPEDVRIIHLGDLIHKGPHSSLLLKTVDKFIRKNPGRWVQILGNHEFQHIEGAPSFWRCTCSLDDIDIINDWYDEGLATPTFGLNGITHAQFEVSAKPKLAQSHGGFLFSHGGLSWDWWSTFNKISDPVQLSEVLNALEVWVVTVPGEMLGIVGRKPGPVWAIGSSEVFDTWVEHNDSMPFSQAHGHTTSYNWRSNRWWRADPAFRTFRNSSKLNPNSRAVITEVQGNLILGIDPGYSKDADTEKQPYLTIDSLA